MKRAKLTLPAFFLIWVLCSGCGSAPARHDNDSASGADHSALVNWNDSSVEITYMLGHSHRRLYLQADPSAVKGETYLERTILMQGSIDPTHYRDFLRKVEDFVARKRSVATAANPTRSPDCRQPFSVTVRSGTATEKMTGCRSMDEGGFSHLVKDGEFLLYSRK